MDVSYIDVPTHKLKQTIIRLQREIKRREKNNKTLSHVGQISNGDTITATYKGTPKTYKNIEVLNRGHPKEEILLEKSNNLYFITALAITGESWAKDVCIDQ